MSSRAFFNIFGPGPKENLTAVFEDIAVNDPFHDEHAIDVVNPPWNETHWNETTTTTTTTEDTNDDFWREISSLTDRQEMTLSLLQISSATLSIIGSTIIIYQVWNCERHRRMSYGRILLGLSLADLVASTSFALAPFLLPADTSQRVWASGNNVSCNFLGFWSQLAYLAPWYNGVLGFYYYLTIRWGMMRSAFAKKYEKWIHIFSVGFFFSSALFGSIIGIYSESELGQGCWVGKKVCCPCHVTTYHQCCLNSCLNSG